MRVARGFPRLSARAALREPGSGRFVQSCLGAARLEAARQPSRTHPGSAKLEEPSMKIPIPRALLAGASLLLLALVPALAAQGADPEAAFTAVMERYQSVSDEYRAKLRAATPEERRQLTAPPVDPFVAEFAEVARSAPQSETAAKAWMMVVQLAPQGSDKEVLGAAVESLARDHAEAEQAASLGAMLARAGGTLGADVAQGHLRKVVELAPKGAMQAGALLGLASSLGDAESTTPGSSAEKELEGVATRLMQEYADVNDARGRSYASVAEGILFARKHLAVGKPAPEIEAADTQGVAFKLSDYRGKVVLLDFWGNW
jgi:hypothetical protein